MTSSEILEELMSLRADFAIHHATKGFDLDYTKALELIRTKRGLNEKEQAQRDVLVAAIDNLIDFSVAAEYQMIEAVKTALSEYDENAGTGEYDWNDEADEYDSDFLIAICKKYNLQFAAIENHDIEYTMGVAKYLSQLHSDTILTYMTQGDERVRPWHLQYEGFSAPKNKFPAWLIPPIEWNCRCYLVEDKNEESSLDVQNKIVRVPTMPPNFDKTFQESVALGGKIFSEYHPYFTIKSEHQEKLTDISDRIKNKYFGNGK